MREFRTSGSVGAAGEQSPAATRPRTQGADLGEDIFIAQDIEGAGIGGFAVHVDHPWC